MVQVSILIVVGIQTHNHYRDFVVGGRRLIVGYLQLCVPNSSFFTQDALVFLIRFESKIRKGESGVPMLSNRFCLFLLSFIIGIGEVFSINYNI